jgi:hypothetical protein
MLRDESATPFLIGGLLIALVLVGTFFLNPPNQAALSRQFVARPSSPGMPTLAAIDLPQVRLPELPSDAQTKISDLTDQLAKGQAIPALTPEVEGPHVRVRVRDIRRDGDHVSIRGSVSNIGTAPLQVTPAAFLFRDSTGVSYATEGTGATTLAAGADTPFDLTVPLPEGRGLTLIVDLPPEPPLEQVLVVEIRP